MTNSRWTRGLVLFGLAGLLIAGCAAGSLTKDETPGQRFDRAMKGLAENCARHPPKPTDSACDPLKLKPADPLGTEEGRFAHAIKIPNPLPADSGYKPGMTPEQYFEHLCKTEAGEFVFKKVENVDGILQMRPRRKANYEDGHLYAPEDPFGFEAGEGFYIGPGRYAYYEISSKASESRDLGYIRYFGYDGHSIKTLQNIRDTHRKSRYGYTWRGIVRPHDRENGIGGVEVIVMDLNTSEVLAIQRGYAKYEIDQKFGLAKAGWGKRCPLIQATGGPYGHFILKVLKPNSSSSSTDGGNNATK